MTVDTPRHGPAGATGTGALMVPGHPRVLLKMITPRRQRAPRYAAQVAAELYGGRARRDPDVARDLLHLTSRLGPARGYYRQLLSGPAWTSLPQLPRLQAPTLILAGDDDPIIPLVNARIMHRLIPNSALHVYSGGHLELADLEAIHTFEGTETMQTLIVGRAITGIGAFT